MRRSAPLSLEGFDPDVIEAAREVAQRAGVPLEAWIESVVSPDKAADGPPDKTAGRPVSGRRPGRPAPRAEAAPAASSGTADRVGEGEEADGQADGEAVLPAPQAEPVTAPPLTAPMALSAPPVAAPSEPAGVSVAAMMRRLDALDRTLSEDRDARREVLREARRDVQAATLDRTGVQADQADQVAERLSEIERRMADLNETLTAPRPAARRGRATPAEMRQALDDVRRRQRELDGDGPGTAPNAGPRAGRQAEIQAQAPSPAILDLQAETRSLRESLGGLATGRDVGALEQAMRALAADVQRGQDSASLPASLPAALAEPIAQMRAQVEHFAEEVAHNVHVRLAGEVERLASRADGSGGASAADRDALDAVHRELDEIRHMIAGLAGPERIQSLAHALQAISSQIAGLREGAEGPAVAELKTLLEEIRSGLSAPNGSQAMLGRIEALAERMDRVTVNPVRDLIGRLETLGESLGQTLENPKRPAIPAGDLAPIQTLLAELAEKVDRVESGHGSLDSLEKHVVALARRLDTRSTDPSLAGLERTMGELLSQVVALRDQSPVEAAVERAARKAVSETLGAGGRPAPGQVEALRAGLDDLRAQQAAADRRMQATMDTLNATLSRLVDRMDGTQPSLDGRLLASTALDARLEAGLEAGKPAARAPDIRQKPLPVSAPQSRSTRQPARPPAEAVDESAFDDELLEPGAGRPAHAQGRGPARNDSVKHDSAKYDSAAAPGGDVKTAFIAAARRAAQAAQADIAAETQGAVPGAAQGVAQGAVNGPAGGAAPLPPERRDAARSRKEGRNDGRSGGRIPAAAAPGLVGRMRQGVERQRRPLLLGLAAVVLVLGAYQAFQLNFGQDVEQPASPSVAGNLSRPVPAAGEAAVAQGSGTPAKAPSSTSAAPAPAGPQTTQSIADAGARDLLAKELLAKDPLAKDLLAKPVAALPPAASAAPARTDGRTEEGAAPARAAIPQVAAMASLGRDLGAVPAGLSGLKQAALNGDGAAVYELAGREADGRGMPRDLALAAKLYEKLAETGYAPAQFKLGSFYEKGSGVVRDLSTAKLWYARAADRGNIRAMHNLAVLHAENPAASGKPDFATAASWFRRAAEFGVRDSQYNLAVLYARGLGLSQDLVQSYAWFSAAAGQGDEEAGKKRDDVALKLAPTDLAAAKSVAAGFRPKSGDPNANEAPPAKPAAPAAMSLLGAPPPGSPTAAGFTPSGPRTGV